MCPMPAEVRYRTRYSYSRCAVGVSLEASPSPVYGAALLMRFGFIAHREFKSPRLRQQGPGGLP